MKKLSLCAVFLSALLLAGCNSTNNVTLNETQWNEESYVVEENTQNSQENTQDSEWQENIQDSSAIASEWQNDEKNILVLYFSRADENYAVWMVDKWNTKFLAEYIADYLGANMFEIEPVIPYPVDYDETTDIAKKELNDNARPEYKWDVDNWDNYDIVFIWYPIWWWDLPMVFYTFIESHDFSWKDIYLFNTHEWSGIAWTYNSLKNKLSTANVNTDWLPMRGTDARKDSAKWEVEKWLQGLWF